ncbi:hypothetical protein [Roseovarius sp. D22-M7]|uniref:hypothetical protein n=1 Tax=Roseovarius sp. D22-M7 TaxID=3127116 RepID=UPI00300F9CE3
MQTSIAEFPRQKGDAECALAARPRERNLVPWVNLGTAIFARPEHATLFWSSIKRVTFGEEIICGTCEASDAERPQFAVMMPSHIKIAPITYRSTRTSGGFFAFRWSKHS